MMRRRRSDSRLVIGVLVGAGEFDARGTLMKAVRMQGILVGSSRMFEKMNNAIEGSRLNPAINKTVAFKEASEPLSYMKRDSHFGKIVVSL